MRDMSGGAQVRIPQGGWHNDAFVSLIDMSQCGDQLSLIEVGWMTGSDCGFNRWTQQIGEIVQRVFRSLAFSLGGYLVASLLHLAWLASR